MAYKCVKKSDNIFCSAKCANNYKVLPRTGADRTIQYIYNLVGKEYLENLINIKGRKSYLATELRSVALDCIRKWIVSDETKKFLLTYITSTIDKYILGLWIANGKNYKLFKKYVRERTYDDFCKEYENKLEEVK